MIGLSLCIYLHPQGMRINYLLLVLETGPESSLNVTIHSLRFLYEIEILLLEVSDECHEHGVRLPQGLRKLTGSLCVPYINHHKFMTLQFIDNIFRYSYQFFFLIDSLIQLPGRQQKKLYSWVEFV